MPVYSDFEIKLWTSNSLFIPSVQRLHGASIQGNSRPFAPKDRTPEGHALVSDFVVHLCDEVTVVKLVMGRMPCR